MSHLLLQGFQAPVPIDILAVCHSLMAVTEESWLDEPHLVWLFWQEVPRLLLAVVVEAVASSMLVNLTDLAFQSRDLLQHQVVEAVQMAKL